VEIESELTEVARRRRACVLSRRPTFANSGKCGPPAITLAKAIQDIKGNTSKWPNDLGLRFAWQEGYSAFSVSQSQRQRVIDYIDGQAEHHKKWSFEQEFLSLLKKSGIAYDERYVLG
jgi:putative transposase